MSSPAHKRFRAAGPSMIPGCERLYPSSLPPAGTPQRYPGSGEPSENTFDLRNPAARDTRPTPTDPSKTATLGHPLL